MVADVPAISYIKQHLALDKRVMMMWDGKGYYCDERCIADLDHSQWTLMAQGANFDSQRITQLLQNAHITHLAIRFG